MIRMVKMKVVDKNTFSEIEKCNCGKDPFRYHNTSKNVFNAKCSSFKYEYTRDLKNITESKKKPCDFHYVYYGERPVFIDTIKKALNIKTVEISLEERLRVLFRFVMVSNHSSTLDKLFQ
jgi:hypothetical protein